MTVKDVFAMFPEIKQITIKSPVDWMAFCYADRYLASRRTMNTKVKRIIIEDGQVTCVWDDKEV